VIGGFGTGNIQSRLIGTMKKISEKGIPMVIATVCHKGSTMLSQYSVGQAAAEAGAIEAKDLTHQAAVQKLMYACGKVKKDFSLLSPKDRTDIFHIQYSSGSRYE
ncbi:MAG: hypothetical protein JEY91_15290, partial [Spirochaetaceae bacterium]|nr:hypothetical protein [Spirochaetaceae bacterium]